MKHCFLNYLYLGVFFMGFSLGVQGQERQVIDDLFEHNKMMTIDLTDKSLQGSMYIEEKLHVASVSGTDALYAMRYNAYYDEMEYEKKGVFYNLPKVFNYTVHFESLNKTYKIYSYPLKGKEEKGFFVLLYSGEKISLLNKEIVKFHEEVKAKSGYDKYIPPKLKRAKDKGVEAYCYICQITPSGIKVDQSIPILDVE